MYQSPTATAWKISCHSAAEVLALTQWLAPRINLDRVLSDTIRVEPDGVTHEQSVAHRLGDYFVAIRIVPEQHDEFTSFQLVFYHRPEANRFWKDLMVNILEEIRLQVQKSPIEVTRANN
jgi:hypothetical protein